MNAESHLLPEPARLPIVVHPGPTSLDDLLRYIDPVPDSETEQFVAGIYADRREASIPPAK